MKVLTMKTKNTESSMPKKSSYVLYIFYSVLAYLITSGHAIRLLLSCFSLPKTFCANLNISVFCHASFFFFFNLLQWVIPDCFHSLLLSQGCKLVFCLPVTAKAGRFRKRLALSLQSSAKALLRSCTVHLCKTRHRHHGRVLFGSSSYCSLKQLSGRSSDVVLKVQVS